jgi:tetratricopeptide (TPR) repeat protein
MEKFYRYDNRGALDEALRFFTEATKLDPEFAAAYAMASLCHLLRKIFGWSTDLKEDTIDGVRAARRAAEFGKHDALALSLAGMAIAHLGKDLNAGLAYIEQATTLNPNLALAWLYAGWGRLYNGEPEAAIVRVDQALRLTPVDLDMAGMQDAMAHAHFFAGRYEEAASWAAKALRELPDFHDALRMTAASNALCGRTEVAQKAVERLRQLDPSLRVSKLREVYQGPYRWPEYHELYEEGMRKAGLPE